MSSNTPDVVDIDSSPQSDTEGDNGDENLSKSLNDEDEDHALSQEGFGGRYSSEEPLGGSSLAGLAEQIPLMAGCEQFSCPLCHKKFIKKGVMRQHMKVHSEKRFTCKSCHYASTRRANLVRHIQRCHMKRPHMCKECNRTFKTEMMLKSHENLHARHEVLKCNQCSYTTLLQTSLKDHLQVVHTGNLSGASQQPEPMVPSDMFVCECGVFFDSQHNLTQHRAMFHGSPQGGANAQLDVSYPIAMEMHTSQSGAGSDFLRHGGPFVSGVANFIPVPTRDLTRGVDTAMSRQNLAETSLKLPLIKAEPKEDYADHSSAPGLPFGDRRAAQESYPSALHVNVSRSSRGISAVTPLFSNVSPRNSAVSQARASYPNPNSSGTPAKPTQYDRRDLESTLDHFESTGALFRCKLCCIFFTDRTMYILHRGLHNSQNDLQCSLCCHISRDKLDFASHFISAHK